MSSLLQIYKNVESAMERMEIPPRPGILDQILLETRQDEPDFLRVATLMSEDISLSASLIKTVNSPFFGLQRKVSAVQDALMMLGLEVASRMVAGILLRHVFPRRPDLDELWDTSLKVALLSHWLASRLGRADGVRPSDVYTFGLFRDSGMAIMLLKKQGYAHTLEAARREEIRAFTEIEQAHHDLNHAVIGSKLAADWRLSDDMAWAILFHHAIATPSPELREETPAALRMTALAQLADKILQDGAKLPNDHEWDKLGARCLEILGLDEQSRAQLADEAQGFITQQLPQLMI